MFNIYITLSTPSVSWHLESGLRADLIRAKNKFGKESIDKLQNQKVVFKMSRLPWEAVSRFGLEWEVATDNWWVFTMIERKQVQRKGSSKWPRASLKQIPTWKEGQSGVKTIFMEWQPPLKHMHNPQPFVPEHMGRFIRQTELQVINTSSCKLPNGSLFAHKIYSQQYVPSPWQICCQWVEKLPCKPSRDLFIL